MPSLPRTFPANVVGPAPGSQVPGACGTPLGLHSCATSIWVSVCTSAAGMLCAAARPVGCCPRLPSPLYRIPSPPVCSSRKS